MTMPKLGVGTAPVWRDIEKMKEKIVAPMEVGGAAIQDIATKGLHYLTGAVQPSNLLESKMSALRQAYGVGGTFPEGTSPAMGVDTMAPTSADVDMFQTTSAPAAPAAPAAAKPHPAAGTKDLWDYASKLPPERLKAFVDKNQGVEGFEGIGYVETKDPKTGGMRIEPTISRPVPPPGPTAKQLTAIGAYHGGVGVRDLTKAQAEKQRADVRKINQEIKQTDVTDPANVSALILKYSPKKKGKTLDPDTGAETTTESLDIAMGVRLFKAAGGVISPEAEALLGGAPKGERPPLESFQRR